jgi:alginate O-acetyltransferase complex protein AlgJ
MAKPFGPAEIKAWANQLSSYWYPSYNTDLVKPIGAWPEADTESAVKHELSGQTFSSPSIVMRGKPEGQAVYNVFLIEGVGATSAQLTVAGVNGTSSSSTGPRTPTPMLTQVTSAIAQELADHGGSWAAWTASVSPFAELVRKRLHATPTAIKAVAGRDGFLFFRHELEYAVAGDLGAQAAGKNPIPALVEWKTLLADHGVDLLFVPVPTKLEVLPDMLDEKLKASAGTLVNPFGRKLLSDLAAAGIETVDLLPAFLAERAHDADAKEALYQAQDTHWTTRGLELAARIVAARIRQYPWYAAFAAKPRPMTIADVAFSRHGDLVSRLPSAARRAYRPESLVGHQVRYADGTAYDDDADSPVIVLGDSYTGVFELTDCLRAGVSAHIARELAQPVDLVMSYGGGPNVRQTLLRRGVEDLNRRRLVVYLMTARDLYDYPDGWEPLKVK